MTPKVGSLELQPKHECEIYAHCGTYTSCNINKTPICACLEGFIPKSPKEWNSVDWSGGCVRETPLACNDRDGFLIHKNVKLPNTSSSCFDKNMSLKECEELCLKNGTYMQSICKFRY